MTLGGAASQVAAVKKSKAEESYHVAQLDEDVPMQITSANLRLIAGAESGSLDNLESRMTSATVDKKVAGTGLTTVLAQAL